MPQKLTSIPDLTIVIPAYSEERRLGATLDSLSRFLKADAFFKILNVEVLIVMADAPDKTYGIAVSKQSLFADAKLLRPGPRVGKGRDVQYGMWRASGSVVCFMDADLAIPLHHLQPFYEPVKAGRADIVVATRDLRSYRTSKLRNYYSYAGNVLYRGLSGIAIEDTQCGFKVFSKKAADICFSKLTIMGWGFDIEVLMIAKVNGMRVMSQRVEDWVNMPFSTHTDGVVRIAFRSVRDFTQVTINRARGHYGVK